MRANRKRLLGMARQFPNWDVSLTNGGHIRLTHQRTGKVLFTSQTPSDWRADRNFSAQVRRAEREIEANTNTNTEEERK